MQEDLLYDNTIIYDVSATGFAVYHGRWDLNRGHSSSGWKSENGKAITPSM